MKCTILENNIYPKARWGFSLEFEFIVLEETNAWIPGFEFEVPDETTERMPGVYVGGRDVCRLEELFFQPAHISAINIEWLLPEAVLMQFVSPDDEYDVLETCREL